MTQRLKAAQTALGPKVHELREADDWRRFANVSIQEQLCAKMEALKPGRGCREGSPHEVRDLQQQWRQAADVPRAQADALWRRFKTAHDEVWAECEAHFAAAGTGARRRTSRERLALCETGRGARRVDVSGFRPPKRSRQLQAEWKTIGPVSRGKEKAIWDRFRAACDRFFTRRHEDLAQRKVVVDENLAKKDALCARAEALAESTDWDQAAAEIKKLQAEWRTIGPVKKSKSDAIWQRFRAACDRFLRAPRRAPRHGARRAGGGPRSDLRRARGVDGRRRSAGGSPGDRFAPLRAGGSRRSRHAASIPIARAPSISVSPRRSPRCSRNGRRRLPAPISIRTRTASGWKRSCSVSKNSRQSLTGPAAVDDNAVADRAAGGDAQGAARRQHDRRQGRATKAASARPPKKSGRRRRPGRGSDRCRTMSARRCRNVSSARCAASRSGRRRLLGAGRVVRAGGAGRAGRAGKNASCRSSVPPAADRGSSRPGSCPAA